MIVMALVLALVLAASHAEATCAWVLWKSTQHSGLGSMTEPKVKKDWHIEHSAPQHAVCERVREAVWRVGVEYGQKRQGPFYKFSWDDKAVGLYFEEIGLPDRPWNQEVQYICLPDTIDPRGPKGGGR